MMYIKYIVQLRINSYCYTRCISCASYNLYKMCLDRWKGSTQYKSHNSHHIVRSGDRRIFMPKSNIPSVEQHKSVGGSKSFQPVAKIKMAQDSSRSRFNTPIKKGNCELITF